MGGETSKVSGIHQLFRPAAYFVIHDGGKFGGGVEGGGNDKDMDAATLWDGTHSNRTRATPESTGVTPPRACRAEGGKICKTVRGGGIWRSVQPTKPKWWKNLAGGERGEKLGGTILGGRGRE